MEKLQNNFTTSEQSKRLLALGVPADSADCWLTMTDKIFEDRHRPHVRTRGYETAKSFFELRAESVLPCWSVGRLIEIFDICYSGEKLSKWENYSSLYKDQSYTDYLMYVFEHNYMCGDMDFSKLEDCA